MVKDIDKYEQFQQQQSKSLKQINEVRTDWNNKYYHTLSGRISVIKPIKNMKKLDEN